jgi:phage tail sheath protein FI
LLIFLETSIKKGTVWVAFEPNTEITCTKVRLQVKNFLTQSWKKGILMGVKQQEAFFLKCDRSTMSQNDIDNGRMNILVGLAPIKPAEFIICINQHTQL